MIIHLKKTVSQEQAIALAENHKAFLIEEDGIQVLITGSGVKEVPADLVEFTANNWVFANDLQLASRKYKKEKRTVKIGNVTIGGTTGNTLLIAGPCSVESEEQIRLFHSIVRVTAWRFGQLHLKTRCQKELHPLFANVMPATLLLPTTSSGSTATVDELPNKESATTTTVQSREPLRFVCHYLEAQVRQTGRLAPSRRACSLDYLSVGCRLQLRFVLTTRCTSILVYRPH